MHLFIVISLSCYQCILFSFTALHFSSVHLLFFYTSVLDPSVFYLINAAFHSSLASSHVRSAFITPPPTPSLMWFERDARYSIFSPSLAMAPCTSSPFQQPKWWIYNWCVHAVGTWGSFKFKCFMGTSMIWWGQIWRREIFWYGLVFILYYNSKRSKQHNWTHCLPHVWPMQWLVYL